jgi:hypothetical protein
MGDSKVLIDIAEARARRHRPLCKLVATVSPNPKQKRLERLRGKVGDDGIERISTGCAGASVSGGVPEVHLGVYRAYIWTLMVELIRAQASLPHRIWCRNPQRQTVTRPKGRHFQWLSLGKSLGSKPE